jgi:hypothetical protein
LETQHHHSKLPNNNAEIWFITTSMERFEGVFIEKENMFLVESEDENDKDFYFPRNVISWGTKIKKQ